MQVRIALTGTDDDFESLWDWLREEPPLRGRLRVGSAPAAPETMGSTSELVVEVASALAGAGAVWAALARSLSDWLAQRRSDVSVEITLPDGGRVSVSAQRVRDSEQVIQTAFRNAREALASRSEGAEKDDEE